MYINFECVVISFSFLVVVYQCSICKVMYTGDIEALFVLVSAVLPHPGLDWQVRTHYGIPHINASLLHISR